MNLIERVSNHATIENKSIYKKHMEHLVNACDILKECGVTDENIIASTLLYHTKLTHWEIEKEFGIYVAIIIKNLSEDRTVDKIGRKKKQMENTKHMSVAAKLVKLSVMYSYLSDLLSVPPFHMNKLAKAKIDYYIKWCFAICEKMYGFNEDLDNKLKKMFSTLGVTDVCDTDLENHYENFWDLDQFYEMTQHLEKYC